MRPAHVALLLSALAAVSLDARAVVAQEDWRPFDPPAWAAPEPPPIRRKPEEPAVPAPPLLAPMDGGPPQGWSAGAGGGYVARGDAARQPDAARPPLGETARPMQPSSEGRPVPPAYLPVERVELAPIDRTELPPVLAQDGSGLPHEFWQGLDTEGTERLIATLALPPRSQTLQRLWRRLLTARVAAPSGGQDNARFLALRIEALWRSGLVADDIAVLHEAGDSTGSVVIDALRARAVVGTGQREAGCKSARALSGRLGELPATLREEVLLLGGYCAAAGGNRAAASLAADLAREQGLSSSIGLQALDAIAAGTKVQATLPDRVTTTEYRLLELAGDVDTAAILPRAEPALAAVLAGDDTLPDAVRAAAGEVAAGLHAISAQDLAAIYRDTAGARQATPGEGPPAGATPPLRRAMLFTALEAERNMFQRARGIRALLDDARRDGFHLAALQMAAPLIAEMPKVAEIGWFAETAIESSIAAGDHDAAQDWVRFAGTLDGRGRTTDLRHWLALSDIADPAPGSERGASLAHIEVMSVRSRFAPEFLHRLATVLDALQYQVPIPLWEAASRSPQPTSGHLPETGVLSDLQAAAKGKEFGRTVLLAMQALGPDGPRGAHMIALGDSIRALKRSGLTAEAHRLGFEALFEGWPKQSLN